MCASRSINGRSVECLFDGVIRRGVDACAERVQVGFHEPREGFQVYEFDGVGERGVSDDGLDAAPFLAVAIDGASSKEGWARVHKPGCHLLRGKEKIEVMAYWKLVATKRVRCFSGF